jgi:hypothetical protein
MDGWWWIPIGLVTWFAVATAVALLLGPVLRSCSQARKALDQDTDSDTPPDPRRMPVKNHHDTRAPSRRLRASTTVRSG